MKKTFMIFEFVADLPIAGTGIHYLVKNLLLFYYRLKIDFKKGHER